MFAAKKVGFIGGGNMGEALIKGLLVSGRLVADQVLVSDISQRRLDHLQTVYQVQTLGDNVALTSSVDVIVLAVKPQQVDDVLDETSASLDHLPLLISIAAGVPLSHIHQKIGRPLPLVRVMPNTPALVLAGASAMAPGTHATEEHINMARQLFEAVGSVVQVSEIHMDAVTGLSGSGPAYVLLFLESLIDAGVFQGLTRTVARDLAIQTTLGTAKLLVESNEHPAVLKDQITSPGGTTIHGLAILERSGMRGMLMEAIAAATRRSEELGTR